MEKDSEALSRSDSWKVRKQGDCSEGTACGITADMAPGSYLISNTEILL